MKPLFVPLKAVYFDRFADGTKKVEYRRYGPRWNEKTCPIGRAVILSRGYGKACRLGGRVEGFECRHGTTFAGEEREAVLAVYGTADVLIACIEIRLDTASCREQELAR